MRSDGTGLERLTDHPDRDIHPYFSPDGKYLLFNSTRGNGSLDVYRLDLATRELLRLTDSPLSETCARYSPDMQAIVLLRNGPTSDDVVILDVESGQMSNLTNTPFVIDGWPMYSADGQPLTITYLDYGKCSTAETPRVEVIHRPSPSPFTSLGQKAAGEGAAIPSPAAIASAVEDALQPFGVKVCDLPLTPEVVWRLANHNPETERRSF